MSAAIRDLIEDKKKLEKKVKELFQEFERFHGNYDLINTISVKRYNGSNNAYGKIVEVDINMVI